MGMYRGINEVHLSNPERDYTLVMGHPSNAGAFVSKLTPLNNDDDANRARRN